jgi:hypothetical protein
MRQAALEIPEPDATGYQNLVRQNLQIDQKSCDQILPAPKCPQSQPKKSK